MAWRVAARTAGRPSRLTTASTMLSGVSPAWMTRAVMPSVQAEADTKQLRRAAVVVRPVAGFQLVLDQAVGGAGIGHPQQRLGQHHQRQALLGGERIGVQEIFHPAKTATSPPTRARIAVTSRVARASMRDSAALERPAAASKAAAKSSSAGA